MVSSALISTYKELIIGSSLEALVYSYFRKIPFLAVNKRMPHEFDFFKPETDISKFRFDLDSKIFKNLHYKRYSLFSKKILWDRLYFLLNINGLNLMPFDCSSIKIEENIIKAITTSGRMGKYCFERAYIFDDQDIIGLPDYTKNKNITYKVYDWMNIRSMQKQSHRHLKSTDNLVKEIFFYPSRRTCIEADNRLDLITISYIKESLLNDYDWSEINARFKVIYILKNLGISVGTAKKLRIETAKREKELITPLYNYENTNNLTFNTSNLSEILKEFENIESPFDSLLKKLHVRKR